MKGGRSKGKGESKRADAKLAVNKNATTKGGRKAAKGKAAKDPNKPKRPASAFFVFMEDFRKQFNKENPGNKAVSAVGKAAGAKWKTMSDAEKAPYVAKAERRKVDYEKEIKDYNKRQAEGTHEADEESDKSVSEVNDEDEGDEEGSDEDDDE